MLGLSCSSRRYTLTWPTYIFSMWKVRNIQILSIVAVNTKLNLHSQPKNSFTDCFCCHKCLQTGSFQILWEGTRTWTSTSKWIGYHQTVVCSYWAMALCFQNRILSWQSFATWYAYWNVYVHNHWHQSTSISHCVVVFLPNFTKFLPHSQNRKFLLYVWSLSVIKYYQLWGRMVKFNKKQLMVSAITNVTTAVSELTLAQHIWTTNVLILVCFKRNWGLTYQQMSFMVHQSKWWCLWNKKFKTNICVGVLTKSGFSTPAAKLSVLENNKLRSNQSHIITCLKLLTVKKMTFVASETANFLFI